MKKYHYASVSMSQLCAIAKVPALKDSYVAQDEETIAIKQLLDTGYRFVAHYAEGDCALFEREFEALPKHVEDALRPSEQKTI